MKSIPFIALALLLGLNLNAQRAEIKTEISASFEDYRSCFSNANQCMKVVYECFQSAMSLENAKEFAREGEKYSSLAMNFATTAAERAVVARELATTNKCEKIQRDMDATQKIFYEAKDEFRAYSEQLLTAAQASDLDKISEIMTTVIQDIQGTIKKLNEGAEKINSSMKGLNTCGEG